MDERIWALPGPRTLIDDTVEEIKAGRHVFIALPLEMAEDPVVTDSLSDAVGAEAGRFTTVRRIFAEPDQPSFLNVVALAVDFDDPPATVPELLNHYAARGVVFVVVAADFAPNHRADLPKFLERVEQETHSAPSEDQLRVVVIGGRAHLPRFRGGEDSDVSLATLWWWNRIARWDTAAHISRVGGPRISERIVADIRAEAIVEVARWDLTLAAQLAEDWSGDLADLATHLHQVCAEPFPESRDRCGVRPAEHLLDAWDARQLDGWHDVYSPAASPHRLRRLVWAAQARIVLPWIEQRREVLQERAIATMGRRRFTEALQLLRETPPTDAGLVEIGDLYKVIEARLGRSEPQLRSMAWRLRDARNKVAHLTPLTLGELGELVNVCRDLY